MIVEVIKTNLKTLLIAMGVEENDIFFDFGTSDTLSQRAFDRLPSAIVLLARDSASINQKDTYTRNARRKGNTDDGYGFKFLRTQSYILEIFARKKSVPAVLEAFYKNLNNIKTNDLELKIEHTDPVVNFGKTKAGDNRGMVRIVVNLSFRFPQFYEINYENEL